VAELQESWRSASLDCCGPVAPRLLKDWGACSWDGDGDIFRGAEIGVGDLDIAYGRGKISEWWQIEGAENG
jgi:hypothetical protein